MAYLTGTYTDVDDALDQFRAFLLTQGWTINDYSAVGSRFRLHVQKTINGVTAYFNLLSCVVTVPFTASGYVAVTGIACHGSTGYNGALAWNAQPGYTSISYATPGSGTSVGGNVTLDNSGGTFYFFDTGTSAMATFTCPRTTAPFQHLAIGATDLGVPVFACSGGLYDSVDLGDIRGSFLGSSRLSSSVNTARSYQSGAWDGTGWNTQDMRNTNTRTLACIVEARTVTGVTDGMYAQQYVNYSPSPIRGNAPLPTCALNVTKGVASQFYPIGTLDGIHFINMTNYASGDEIIYGGDTFKVFTNNTLVVAGVAFRK